MPNDESSIPTGIGFELYVVPERLQNRLIPSRYLQRVKSIGAGNPANVLPESPNLDDPNKSTPRI